MRYNTPDDKGETRKERNERFGVESPEEPEVPDTARHIWDSFWELGRRRGKGPDPLNDAQLDSWMRLRGGQLAAGDIQLVFDMDDAFLSAYAEEISAMQERERERASARKNLHGSKSR